MSKITGVLAVLLLLCFGAGAQISKGDYLIGGNGSFKRYTSELPDATRAKTTLIGFSTDAGRFFLNRFAAGISANIQYGNHRYERDSVQSSPSGLIDLGVGPFARYYFLNTTSKVNLLMDGRTGWRFSRSSVYRGDRFNYYGQYFDIYAGPAFFLSKFASLELLVGYSRFKSKGRDAKFREFSSRAGLHLHFPR
jgi:hypothetical protein